MDPHNFDHLVYKLENGAPQFDVVYFDNTLQVRVPFELRLRFGDDMPTPEDVQEAVDAFLAAKLKPDHRNCSRKTTL